MTSDTTADPVVAGRGRWFFYLCGRGSGGVEGEGCRWALLQLGHGDKRASLGSGGVNTVASNDCFG